MASFSSFTERHSPSRGSEAESKEKHGVWDPMPHSRVDSNIFTMCNHMPESTLTLSQSRLSLPVRDFGFDLWLKVVSLEKSSIMC